MRQFGFHMDGCEAGLEKLMVDAIAAHKQSIFTYMEIGVAHAQTLCAMADIMRENCNGKSFWAAFGVDLPDGNTDSHFDREDAKRILIKHGHPLAITCDSFNFGVSIILKPSQELLANWAIPINFCLIDACHGKNCVMADFRGVEKICESGAVVVFHDAGQKEQGLDPSSHCGEAIGVVAAIEELGLMDRASGWEYLERIQAERSCAVFRKL
jgi:hypothetical protein